MWSHPSHHLCLLLSERNLIVAIWYARRGSLHHDRLELDMLTKEVERLGKDYFVLVWIERTGRVDDGASRFGRLDRRDEELELRPSDLVDLFSLPELERVV